MILLVQHPRLKEGFTTCLTDENGRFLSQRKYSALKQKSFEGTWGADFIGPGKDILKIVLIVGINTYYLNIKALQISYKKVFKKQEAYNLCEDGYRKLIQNLHLKISLVITYKDCNF